MQVSLRAASDPQWSEYATHHPAANPFHHPSWLETLHRCYRYRPFVVAATDAGGALRAGLPMMEVSSLLTGRRWVALPFTDHLAPLYDDAEGLAAVTGWLADAFRAGRLPALEVRSELASLGACPGARAGDSYVTHSIPLTPDRDELDRRIDRRHRQNVRAARKHGVVVERGDSLDHMRAYFLLQVQTRHRQGVPAQPWAFFRTLSETVMRRGLGTVLLARKDGADLAGLVCLHSNGYCVAKYAASRADALQLRPNDLVFDTAIGWAAESGCHTFDFGRTDPDNTGLRRYKRGWGADESELTYTVLSRRPPRSRALNGRGRASASRVLKASPVWVCRASGRVLYRHFG